MKKKEIWMVVIGAIFIVALLLVRDYYDQDARALKDYKKENQNLRLIAERRELQFKILSYEKQLGIRRARPVGQVPKPDPYQPQAELPKPVDPNK